MQYYVIAANGQKYGPADVPTLCIWAQEGRVLPTSMLEDSATRALIPATSVSGIVFPIVPAGGMNYQSPGYEQYPRQFANDDGTDDVKKVWLFGGLAFIPCCPLLFGLVFGSLAIVFATSAQKKGNPQGSTVMTFAIVSLVGGTLLSLVLRAVLAGVFRSVLRH